MVSHPAHAPLPVPQSMQYHGCRVCTGTELRSRLPRPHRDWAHRCHVCAGTGPAPATSAPGFARRTAAPSASTETAPYQPAAAVPICDPACHGRDHSAPPGTTKRWGSAISDVRACVACVKQSSSTSESASASARSGASSAAQTPAESCASRMSERHRAFSARAHCAIRCGCAWHAPDVRVGS